MAKAYRVDVVNNPKFQEEVRRARSANKADVVSCPVAGCECVYEMYGRAGANSSGDTATLQERLRREHPGHTSEVLAVNQFRKPRR